MPGSEGGPAEACQCVSLIWVNHVSAEHPGEVNALCSKKWAHCHLSVWQRVPVVLSVRLLLAALFPEIVSKQITGKPEFGLLRSVGGEREGGKVSSEVTGLPSAGLKLPSSVYSYLQSMSQLQLRLRMQLPQPDGDSMSLWDRQAGSLCCPGLLLPHGSQCSQAAQEFQGGKRRLCELRPTLRWDRRNHLYSVSGD